MRLHTVIRSESEGHAVKMIDAVIKGGINAVEITMTVPGTKLEVMQSGKSEEKKE